MEDREMQKLLGSLADNCKSSRWGCVWIASPHKLIDLGNAISVILDRFIMLCAENEKLRKEARDDI